MLPIEEAKEEVWEKHLVAVVSIAVSPVCLESDRPSISPLRVVSAEYRFLLGASLFIYL